MRIVGIMFVIVLLATGWDEAHAFKTDCLATNDPPSTNREGDSTPCSQDLQGNQRVTQGTLESGEDELNNVVKVEHQGTVGTAAAADTLIYTGAGRLYWVFCGGNDGASTAGLIQIRDSTTAGGGTVRFSIPVAAGVTIVPIHDLDMPFTTGLYIDYTTTDDVTCSVGYRQEALP